MIFFLLHPLIWEYTTIFITCLEKQYTTNVTSHERLDAYTSFNDDKDSLYEAGNDEHIIGDSRSMDAWQITLTAMVGL